jgi:glutamate racemase
LYLPDHFGSIGVFDSGIGGLSVANAISGQLPRQRLLYLADNARAPYGHRSREEVLTYSRQCTRFLLGAGARLIVVACNTATSVAIDALRREFADVPFVGMEPAIKPAAGGGRIGVMATAVTLGSPRYASLRSRFLEQPPAWESDCPGLVSLIENHGPGSREVQSYLENLLSDCDSLDTLVLGCTHYPLVRADIAAVVGPRVRLIDPAPAAARQVVRMLGDESVFGGGKTPVYDFVCTGAPPPLQRTLLQLPELNRHRRWLLPYISPQ